MYQVLYYCQELSSQQQAFYLNRAPAALEVSYWVFLLYTFYTSTQVISQQSVTLT